MKKLMFMLAAVAMAASVQAATVSWGSTTMYSAEGAKVKNSVTVYVYMLADADAYDGLTDIWGTYGADVKTGGASADNKTTSGTYTSKATVPSPDGSAVANTTHYAAIIATIGTGDDMKYYAEKASVTTGDDGNGGYTTFGAGHIDSASAAATGWQSASVPEPTSGLLMLVGLAGLALRRKRS